MIGVNDNMNGATRTRKHDISDPVFKRIEYEIKRYPESVKETREPTIISAKRKMHLANMIWVIGKVYNNLPDDKKKLIDVRYWSNKKLSWEGIASTINCSRSTAIRWRDEFVSEVAELMGWK